MAKRTRIKSSKKGLDVSPREEKQLPGETYAERIAMRIRDLRKKADMDVATLAQKVTKAGYPLAKPTLSHWENGTRDVNLNAIPYLAKALKVNLAELVID